MFIDIENIVINNFRNVLVEYCFVVLEGFKFKISDLIVFLFWYDKLVDVILELWVVF